MDVHIVPAENGFILHLSHGTEVFKTLDEVFNRLLTYYEGRTTFTVELYGKVEIHRGGPS